VCVCLRAERNIEQHVKSGHHISVSKQHFNFNLTSPMSNWQHICATPAQPLHRVLKRKCQRWKNQRLWGKKNITESKWKVLINAFKDLGWSCIELQDVQVIQETICICICLPANYSCLFGQSAWSGSPNKLMLLMPSTGLVSDWNGHQIRVRSDSMWLWIMDP